MYAAYVRILLHMYTKQLYERKKTDPFPQAKSTRNARTHTKATHISKVFIAMGLDVNKTDYK